jgi:hypothetical protein
VVDNPLIAPTCRQCPGGFRLVSHNIRCDPLARTTVSASASRSERGSRRKIDPPLSPPVNGSRCGVPTRSRPVSGGQARGDLGDELPLPAVVRTGAQGRSSQHHPEARSPLSASSSRLRAERLPLGTVDRHAAHTTWHIPTAMAVSPRLWSSRMEKGTRPALSPKRPGQGGTSPRAKVGHRPRVRRRHLASAPRRCVRSK